MFYSLSPYFLSVATRCIKIETTPFSQFSLFVVGFVWRNLVFSSLPLMPVSFPSSSPFSCPRLVRPLFKLNEKPISERGRGRKDVRSTLSPRSATGEHAAWSSEELVSPIKQSLTLPTADFPCFHADSLLALSIHPGLPSKTIH